MERRLRSNFSREQPRQVLLAVIVAKFDEIVQRLLLDVGQLIACKKRLFNHQ